MQERHSGFDVVVRLATHAIHLLDQADGSLRERTVRPLVDVLARFGDPTPVRIDPSGRPPAVIVGDALAAAVGDSLKHRRVLALVPDHWGLHRHEMVTSLLTELGAEPDVRPETGFLLEHNDGAPGPEDAALWVRVGSELTTAALVHRDGDQWLHAHRVETGWGGDDLDDLLVGFVNRRLPDPAGSENLRSACREARERLSTQVTAGVSTDGGGVHLHRKDVEELAAPGARAALTATLGQVLALSDRPTTTVLISGGTARMPLIAQLVSEIAALPVRLADWRDAVDAVIVRNPVPAVIPAADGDTRLPRRVGPPARRRRNLVAVAAVGGVAVMAFGVLAATQSAGGAGLMRMMLGESGAAVPVGPPGAYAAQQPGRPSPESLAAPPAAPTSSSAADQTRMGPGDAMKSPAVPGATPESPAGPTGDGTTRPVPSEPAAVDAPAADAPAASLRAAESPTRPAAAPRSVQTTTQSPVSAATPSSAQSSAHTTTKPTTEAAQPTTEATQPTTEATQPTTEAAQPTTEESSGPTHEPDPADTPQSGTDQVSAETAAPEDDTAAVTDAPTP